MHGFIYTCPQTNTLDTNTYKGKEMWNEVLDTFHTAPIIMRHI